MNLSLLNGLTAAAVPAVPPANGPITSGYNKVRTINGKTRTHRGVDIGVGVGSPVKAAADGVVIRVEQNVGDAGNIVVVQHADGTTAHYFHLQGFNVKPGQKVKANDVVGKSGGEKGAPGAGNSQGPHLHFEVRDKNGNPIDPRAIMKAPASTAGGSRSASSNHPEPTTKAPAPAPPQLVQPIVQPPMETFSVSGEDPNADIEGQIAQIQAQIDEYNAEHQARAAERAGIRTRIADLEGQPLPEAPVMPEGGGFGKRESGNALLGAALMAAAGLDARSIGAAVGGYQGAKTAQAQQNYAEDTQAYNQTIAGQDKELRRLATQDKYLSDDLGDMDVQRDRLMLKVPDLSGKLVDRKNKDFNNLFDVATDPNRSKGDRMAAYAVMGTRGYLKELSPQQRQSIADSVNQDGAKVKQARDNYNLAVDKAEVDKQYKNWRKNFDERKFKESVSQFRTRLKQQWTIHADSIKNSWAQLNTRQTWEGQKQTYDNLQKQYGAAVTEFNNMEGKARMMKSQVAAGRQSIRDQVTAIGKMKSGSSEERKAQKALEEDRIKVAKAESEFNAFEKELGAAKAQLEDLKPPPLAPNPAGGK